jgi:hypothetical protein
MTNCKQSEGYIPQDCAPVSRAHAHARVHLSEQLIAELSVVSASMARRERLTGQPLNIEQFAERVIRATLGAINANAADERVRGWHFEKVGIAMMTEEQAQQCWERWKASVTA